MEQKSNFILFIVVCLAVVIGWIWLQGQLWPPQPPKKKDEQKAAEKKKDAKKEAPPGQWVAFEKLGPLAQKTVLYAGAVTTPTPGVGALPILLRDDQIQIVKAKEKPEPEFPLKEFVLGGGGYFLEVVVTSKGAGVKRVTFTPITGFRAADSLGRPTDKPLNIVEEDDLYPSYLLYHYLAKDDDRPVFGLDKNWRVQGVPSPEEARFSTRVPGFPGLELIKTYRLGKKDYHVGLTLEIKDTRPAGEKKSPPFRYQFAGPHGVPLEGMWYSTAYRNAVVGIAGRSTLWRELEDSKGVSIRQGSEKILREADKFIQYAGVMNQYFAALIVLDDTQKNKDKVLAWARATAETSQVAGKIAGLNGKFLQLHEAGKGVRSFELLKAAQENLQVKEMKVGDDAVVTFYEHHDKEVATSVRPGKVLQPFTDDITVRVNSEPIELEPGGQSVTHSFLLYHGPAKVRLLNQFTGDRSVPDELVDRYAEALQLYTLTDYVRVAFWGDLIVACTKLMHLLLYVLSFILPNYGLTIILLTVVVRGLMFPISRKQALLSLRMQQLAPELKKVQEKYKSDKQARMQATMELYRKHGANPLGGCLPLLLQLPVFLGLYFALQESIHFRLAGFLWIENLAAPDMLIYWGEGIPVISDPDMIGTTATLCGIIPLSMFYLGPYFNVLPILAVALMIMQQKMLTPPPQDEQQAMQQKILRWMMPIIGIMFYKVAAGLCLYFIASSLWGLAERKLLPKKGTGTAVAATGPVAPPAKGLRNRPRPGEQAKKPNGAFQKVKDWWADILKQAKKK